MQKGHAPDTILRPEAPIFKHKQAVKDDNTKINKDLAK